MLACRNKLLSGNMCFFNNDFLSLRWYRKTSTKRYAWYDRVSYSSQIQERVSVRPIFVEFYPPSNVRKLFPLPYSPQWHPLECCFFYFTLLPPFWGTIIIIGLLIAYPLAIVLAGEALPACPAGCRSSPSQGSGSSGSRRRRS